MKILRTACGSTVSWGLIEKLQQKGVEVIGCDTDPYSHGLYLLRSSYVVPKANDPKFIEEMLEIVEVEGIDAILGGPEEELLELSKYRLDLKLRGCKLLCPAFEHLEICVDKSHLYDFFEDIEILTPELYNSIVENVEEYVVKPRVGRGGGGVRKVNKCQDFRRDYGHLLQKYIEGDEYSVDVLADKDGNACNIIPRLRVQTAQGKSIKSVTVRDEVMIEECRRIAKGLRLYGPSCIQCVKRDDINHYIDVNPRFGGGAVLSAHADRTLIDNLILLIKGEKPEYNAEFGEGIVMLRYYKELYTNEVFIKDG